MELNKMILIERLQRAGATEQEILRSIAEMDGREYNEKPQRFWRRLGNAIFVTLD